MLVSCLTRQNKHKQTSYRLSLAPLETGKSESTVNLYETQPFSSEELVKVYGLLNMCDEDTCAHSWRIAHLAREVACYLRLSNTEVWIAFLSALMHDIGKARLPRELLNKQGPLNSKEWEIIRQHPEIGAQMLEEVGGKAIELAPFVLSHHERWDGEGYPHRVRGEQIPLIGRLLAVVDSFDAMTSQRPYQRSLTDVEACMELQRCAGSQYDPLFVDAFLCMLSVQNPSIPSWSFPAIQLPAVHKPAIA
jgi:putative nucleotidyltransferase with HDIG domain